MKNVLGATDIKVAYIFTDWRMWIYLFDLVEGSGLGVRNMIVWNKQSPGMGNGWRAQHELIMFAHRTKPKWDNHKGYGNVLEATRSGNELHPTQKPVEILEKLLDNTQWAEGVLDTFGGSGTTLIGGRERRAAGVPHGNGARICGHDREALHKNHRENNRDPAHKERIRTAPRGVRGDI